MPNFFQFVFINERSIYITKSFGVPQWQFEVVDSDDAGDHILHCSPLKDHQCVVVAVQMDLSHVLIRRK